MFAREHNAYRKGHYSLDAIASRTTHRTVGGQTGSSRQSRVICMRWNAGGYRRNSSSKLVSKHSKDNEVVYKVIDILH